MQLVFRPGASPVKDAINPVSVYCQPVAGTADQTLLPTGFANSSAYGAATVTPGLVDLTPTGFANGSAYGSASISVGPVSVLPASLVNANAFGSASVSSVYGLSATGFANTSAYGSPTLSSVSYVLPTGAVNAQSYGAASVSTSNILLPLGYQNVTLFGAHQVTQSVTVNGFFVDDTGDAAGLVLVPDITGETDMWFQADGGDAAGVIPRTSEASPNFPDEDEVILDVAYGYNLEFVGVYNGSGGIPVPEVEAEDDRNGESCTVTVTESDADAVNTVQISPFGQQGAYAWADQGTITGNGAVVCTVRRGLYACRVKSAKDGGAVYGMGNLFWISGAREPKP